MTADIMAKELVAASIVGKIYVVIGKQGNYSDKTEWVVMAFGAHEPAMAYRDKCQEYMDNKPDDDDPDWMAVDKYVAANPYDTGVSYHYGETEYRVEEVPFGVAIS
jgi:hypothetical protein